tara:strand:- start:45 stop:1505 length:1461 start_codon:yes stop_codon:yes gene_type:complete
MINGGFKMSKQDLELMAHLLRRAGFGATREELEVCIDKGYEETVEELLNPTSSESMPDDIIHRYHVDIHESRYGPSAASNWLYRLITTTSPLIEKIPLFWHGIFATGYTKTNQARALLNQIDMFRRHGLGKFDNLLMELSKDPAMLIWLDNQDNHDGAINENFGRELLELFSMGVGNYSEEDIKEASRAFTGWTLDNAEYMAIRAMKDSIWPYGRISWHFGYRPEDHDNGNKKFLDEAGNLNGKNVIDAIARNPATAEFVARHIYDFFVADEPPVPQWPYKSPRDPKAIKILTDAYFESGYEIKAMLRALFNADFFKTDDVRYARVKGPAELVVGSIRTSGDFQKPTLDILDVSYVCEFMGQSLLSPPTVEGWHEGTEWINSGSLVERINFVSKQLGDTTKPGIQKIISSLKTMDGGHFKPHDLVETCLDLIGPLNVSDKTKQALVSHVSRDGDLIFSDNSDDDKSEARVGNLLSVIAATREYQMG